MSALQFEALKVALKQDSTGYVLTVKIHPDEIPEELLRDFVGARYMVAMARLNDDETPVPVNNRVQKAGMLCRNKNFQKFCYENLGFDESEEGATKAIYESCRVRSRTELNGNSDAKKAFDELVDMFTKWEGKDVPF